MSCTEYARSNIIYIQTGSHNLTHTPDVRIGDICRVESENPVLARAVRNIRLYHYSTGDDSGKNVVVFSILKVIACIHEAVGDVCVVNLGAAEFIIEYIPKCRRPEWLKRLKLAGVGAITFFGSAFTIMAFNNDISVDGVFERFYRQVIGVDKPAVTEIEVCYSIGLAVGIMFFFNHVGRKKITMDPTPLQVELRKYESDVADTLIENAGRDAHSGDVE